MDLYAILPYEVTASVCGTHSFFHAWRAMTCGSGTYYYNCDKTLLKHVRMYVCILAGT